jgi:hypothetical protein
MVVVQAVARTPKPGPVGMGNERPRVWLSRRAALSPIGRERVAPLWKGASLATRRTLS